jgi:hypothetical protein
MEPFFSFSFEFWWKLFLQKFETPQRKLLETPEEKPEKPSKPLPGRAVLIENNVVEEKPFKSNDELPEAELYFGGEKETETERDLRMIRISQREEMSRL